MGKNITQISFFYGFLTEDPQPVCVCFLRQQTENVGKLLWTNSTLKRVMQVSSCFRTIQPVFVYSMVNKYKPSSSYTTHHISHYLQEYKCLAYKIQRSNEKALEDGGIKKIIRVVNRKPHFSTFLLFLFV